MRRVFHGGEKKKGEKNTGRQLPPYNHGKTFFWKEKAPLSTTKGGGGKVGKEDFFPKERGG